MAEITITTKVKFHILNSVSVYALPSVKQDAVISSDYLCLLGMLTQRRAYLLTHSSIGELSFILNPVSLLILATKVLIF